MHPSFMTMRARSTGIDVERVEEGAGDVANDGKLGRVSQWSQGVERRTEREERLEALILKRSKLDARDAAFLDEVYTQVMRTHHRGVWDYLRRRGFQVTEVEDLVLEELCYQDSHFLPKCLQDPIQIPLRRVQQHPR